MLRNVIVADGHTDNFVMGGNEYDEGNDTQCIGEISLSQKEQVTLSAAIDLLQDILQLLMFVQPSIFTKCHTLRDPRNVYRISQTFKLISSSIQQQNIFTLEKKNRE